MCIRDSLQILTNLLLETVQLGLVIGEYYKIIYIPDIALVPKLIFKEVIESIEVHAVSYTHLDVYKRQTKAATESSPGVIDTLRGSTAGQKPIEFDTAPTPTALTARTWSVMLPKYDGLHERVDALTVATTVPFLRTW